MIHYLKSVLISYLVEKMLILFNPPLLQFQLIVNFIHVKPLIFISQKKKRIIDS